MSMWSYAYSHPSFHTAQAVPDSALATNFKACNTYRLFQVGKQAEADFRALDEVASGRWQEHPLIKHNLVVFRCALVRGAPFLRLDYYFQSNCKVSRFCFSASGPWGHINK